MYKYRVKPVVLDSKNLKHKDRFYMTSILYANTKIEIPRENQYQIVTIKLFEI